MTLALCAPAAAAQKLAPGAAGSVPSVRLGVPAAASLPRISLGLTPNIVPAANAPTFALPSAPALPFASILPAAAPSIVPGAAPLSGPAAAQQQLSFAGGPHDDSPSFEARLNQTFDNSAAGDDQAPPARARSARTATGNFLDEHLRAARKALRAAPVDIPGGFQALETIFFAQRLSNPADYEAWMTRHERQLRALDRMLARAVAASISAKVAEGDYSGARHRLDELAERHPVWAEGHADLLTPLRSLLPSDDGKQLPQVPNLPPSEHWNSVRLALEERDFRRAEYLVDAIEAQSPAWAAAHKTELEGARAAILGGIYQAFEAKKAAFSPVEAARLSRYMRAKAEGKNRLYGFKEPRKQDPQTLMCTIMSICSGLEAATGFADPSMNIDKFTELVREILKDPTLGTQKGLSTHRVRTLMKALGYELRVVEMQHRLRHPFTEAELLHELRLGQIVIPVLIIAQNYPDEVGLYREEHKNFIRDAYFDETEKAWVYLAMDPLIGRMSFYTFEELKPLLHKLFVIRTEKPFAAPNK